MPVGLLVMVPLPGPILYIYKACWQTGKLEFYLDKECDHCRV